MYMNLNILDLTEKIKLVDKWSKDSGFIAFVVKNYMSFDEKAKNGESYMPHDFDLIHERLKMDEYYVDAFLAYINYQIHDCLYYNDLDERQFRMWWLYNLYNKEVEYHPDLKKQLKSSDVYTKLTFVLITLFHYNYLNIKKRKHANKKSRKQD